MSKLRSRLRKLLLQLPAYTLSIVCLATICYLTLDPKPLPDNDLGLIPGLDKIVHAIMFFGLALCITTDNARRHLISHPDCHTLAIPGRLTAAIIAAIAGGAIELLQQQMDLGRSADIIDLLADSTGAVIAYFSSPAIIRYLLSPKSTPTH